MVIDNLATDPIEQLKRDRTEARQLEDPMVDRCVLGSITSSATPALRTLVLRDIENRLAIFYSRTSAKQTEFMRLTNKVTILVFLPSIGVQYRIQANLDEVPRELIEQHWHMKPNAAKRMDSIYEKHPQSAVIEDFSAFETLYAATVPPIKPPRNAVGSFLDAYQVEYLRLQVDPHFHDRLLFTRRVQGDWVRVRLVP